MARFPQARELRNKQDEADWNAGRIPLLLLHPASAGHGPNLQHGGHILVGYGLTWNLEHDEQVIERIGPTRQYQAGINRPVIRHRLVAKGTIDRLVLRRLATKAFVQQILMEALL